MFKSFNSKYRKMCENVVIIFITMHGNVYSRRQYFLPYASVIVQTLKD